VLCLLPQMLEHQVSHFALGMSLATSAGSNSNATNSPSAVVATSASAPSAGAPAATAAASKEISPDTVMEQTEKDLDTLHGSLEVCGFTFFHWLALDRLLLGAACVCRVRVPRRLVPQVSFVSLMLLLVCLSLKLVLVCLPFTGVSNGVPLLE
jgi:hypothetical protein